MIEIPWYVIHTHARQEARAEDNLRRQHVETLLPLVRVRRLNTYSRPVESTAPLFSRYLFAAVPDSMITRVRSTRGVHSFVGRGGYPVAVDVSIVEEVRAHVGEDGFVKLEAECDPLTCDLAPNQPVRILEGPFSGLEGIFQRSSNDKRRVQILLNAVCGMRIEIERTAVVAA